MVPTTTAANSNEGAALVSPVAQQQQQQQQPPAFGARKTSGRNGGLGKRKNSSIVESNGGKHSIDCIGTIGGTSLSSSSSSSSKRRMATLIDVLERCRDHRHHRNISSSGSSMMTMMTTTPRTAFETTMEDDGSHTGHCPAYVSAISSSSSSWSSSAYSSPAYASSPSSHSYSSNYSVMECVPTSSSFASTSTSTCTTGGSANTNNAADTRTASLPEALPTSFVSPVFAPRRRRMMMQPSTTKEGSTSGSSGNDHLLLDRYLAPGPAHGHDSVVEGNTVGLASVADGGRGIGGGAGGIIGWRPITTATTTTGSSTGLSEDVLTLATDEDDANLAAKHAFGRRWLYECTKEPIEPTASAASATGTSTTKPNATVANTEAVGSTSASSSSFNNDSGMSIFVGDNKENVDPAAARKKKKCRTNPRTTTTNTNTVSLTTATHRLCLRCRHCRNETDVLRPKSLSEYHFYSKIVRWSATHYESCPALPPVLQMRYEEAKANASRGRKQFWAESAAKIGLVDIVDEAGRVGHGVAFASDDEDANDGAAGGGAMAVKDYGMAGK